jgi:cytochrome c biogenesis factor
MKIVIFITLLVLVVVALTGNKETRRQYFAISALFFFAALASFGNYTTTYIRGYKAEPFQVIAIQVCLCILGIFSLRTAMRKKK